MAAPPALRDGLWDGSTCASIVLGASRVTFSKFSPGKATVKRDKPSAVGDGQSRRRTPGHGEIGDFNGELYANDYESQILPRMPAHGGTLVEFNIIVSIKHPSIVGSVGVLLDGVSIIEIDGPELTGDEKALVYKLQFSAMRRYDRGRDGKWKGLAYDTSRPSAQAVALMKF